MTIEEKRKYQREWRRNNRDHVKAYSKAYGKAYRLANKEKEIERHKRYVSDSKVREERSEYARKWYKKNRTQVIKKQMAYSRGRYFKSINFRLASIHRSRINKSLKFKRDTSSVSYLGCSIENLIQHIESQWSRGMAWKNYGEWHIDHIKPLCTFNLSKEEDAVEAFNYKNLRPLWAMDNLTRPRRYYEN